MESEDGRIKQVGADKPFLEGKKDPPQFGKGGGGEGEEAEVIPHEEGDRNQGGEEDPHW